MGEGEQTGRDASRAFDRVRFWIIVAMVLALIVPAVISYRRLWRNLLIPDPFRSHGEVALVLEQLSNNRMVSVYTGLAAREVAGGKVESIAAPQNLWDLADREPDEFKGIVRCAFSPTFIRQSSGGLLVASTHDVVLTDEELEALRDIATFVEFPHDVFAVVGDVGETGVTLYTDAERHNVYVVPDSLTPGSDP